MAYVPRENTLLLANQLVECASEPLPPLSPQLSGRISHLLFIPRVPTQNEQKTEHSNRQKGARFLVIGTTAFGTCEPL